MSGRGNIIICTLGGEMENKFDLTSTRHVNLPFDLYSRVIVTIIKIF